MTQPDPIALPAGLTVTAQTEATKIGTNGQAQQVMTVTFRLADGTVGSVDVPVGAYTVDNVRAMIAAKAAILDAVNQIAG